MPRKRTGAPSTSRRSAAGPEPPSRVKRIFRSKARPIARATARRAGWSSGVRQGRVAGWKAMVCRMPAGTREAVQAVTASWIRSGSWPSTSRKLIFTRAEEGMIVLPFTPW